MDKMAILVGNPSKTFGEFQEKPNEKMWRMRDLNPGQSYFAVYHTLFEMEERKETDSSS
jgi:hypothetical protein